ncbi:hypothetical protein J4N45_23395 [Vibrio sp. SCSIO 43140]|uniref:hypothetical protein n=1 Tax=Vibrio sp. SCSIO 43140 TaxID=2819100 RepID=UPI00207666FD|nr:hypothetical protein [Vibrio sp. SCSIO 43140]USD62322.1 hypothetical protein J4N45_23395 [Vibrio sp. SCSIO 43140]
MNKSITQAEVTNYIQEWFEQMDTMPTSSDFFTQRLADDIKWISPGFCFDGKEHFDVFLQGARAMIKPECKHTVEHMVIRETDGYCEAILSMHMVGQSFEDSEFKGQPLDLRSKEVWRFVRDTSNQIKMSKCVIEVA